MLIGKKFIPKILSMFDCETREMKHLSYLVSSLGSIFYSIFNAQDSVNNFHTNMEFVFPQENLIIGYHMLVCDFHKLVVLMLAFDECSEFVTIRPPPLQNGFTTLTMGKIFSKRFWKALGALTLVHARRALWNCSLKWSMYHQFYHQIMSLFVSFLVWQLCTYKSAIIFRTCK